MGFSNMNGLPRIQNFAAAARVYNNIKPIRGTTFRPLGKRRDKHYAIEQRGESYVCTLYGHRVITYSKDEYGRDMATVNMCGYDTMTTRGFITRVLGADCYSRKDKTYIEVGKRATKDPETGKYKVTGAYYLPANHPLQIKLGEVLNPVPVTKKVLDREITKELRDKYKEEMLTAESMLRLGPARYSEEYIPREKETNYRGQFMTDLTSEEMTEYLWLLASFDYIGKTLQVQKYHYNIARQMAEPVGTPSPTYRTYVVNALYEIAKRDAIDIHKEVELPVGQRV